MVSGRDLGYFYDDDKSIFNWVFVFETEKLDTEAFEKLFFDKAISKIRRLRQSVTNAIWIWLWKDLDPEDVQKQCFTRLDSDMRTHEEITTFVTKLSHSRLPLDRPQWDIYIKEDALDNKSVIIFRASRWLGDGISILSIFSFINDKINGETLPQCNSSKFSSKLISLVLTPLYATIAFCRFYGLKKDKDAKCFELKNGRRCGIKELAASEKSYSVEKLRKAAKDYNVADFDEFLIVLLGVAVKKYMNTHESEKWKFLTLSLPVNLRKVVTKVEELSMTNHVGIIKGSFDISTNIKECVKHYMNSQLKKYSKRNYALGTCYSLEIWRLFPPKYFQKLFGYRSEQQWDFTLNILHGPKKNLSFDGSRVLNIKSWIPNTTYISTSFCILTYGDEIRLQIMNDKNIDLKLDKIVKYFENELDLAINTYSVLT